MVNWSGGEIRRKESAWVVLSDAVDDVFQGGGSADSKFGNDAGTLRESGKCREIPRHRALLGHIE